VFTVTSYINLIAQKVDPDKDIRWLFYSDYGLDLYSNGVMVSQRLLKENPKAIAGLVRALSRAFVETAGDPDAAIALMMKREPLLSAESEKQRLMYAFKNHFVSPETAQIGVGDIVDNRMTKAINVIVESYQLPNTPGLSDIFDRSFLPAKDTRLLRLKM
jgi:NitT/TauT family transport system substrate-binding protein